MSSSTFVTEIYGYIWKVILFCAIFWLLDIHQLLEDFMHWFWSITQDGLRS